MASKLKVYLESSQDKEPYLLVPPLIQQICHLFCHELFQILHIVIVIWDNTINSLMMTTYSLYDPIVRPLR